MRTVVLVDGMNLAFRMHHVNMYLANKAGQKTGVLYGVLKTIPSLRKKLGDCSIIWCWEGGVAVPGTPVIPSWRKELATSYKANRTPNPDLPSILFQLNETIKILDVLGYPKAYLPGLEADDLIGVFANKLSQEGTKVYILTADRDMFQCIDSFVTVVRPSKDGLDYYNEKKVFQEFSVYPNQWAHYKALIGDPSDNYKGVPKVGPVKAVKMLADGVNPELPDFESLPKQTKKAYPKLKEHWPLAHHCYQLSQIPRSVTFPLFAKEVRKSLKENVASVDKLLNTGYDKSTFPQRLNAWTKFCAKYDLMSFLVDRRQFFAFR